MSSGALLAPASAPPLPPTTQTLALLATYGVTYPGLSIDAPTLNTTQLTTATSLSQVETMTLFLTDAYPLLQPSTYSPVAFYELTVTTGAAVSAEILNFAAISNQNTSQIIPPETAKTIYNAISGLQQIYHEGLLTYMTSVFDAHQADIVDNPHHDHVLINLWSDFFQGLYTQYQTSTTTPMDQPTFIILRTVASTRAYPSEFSPQATTAPDPVDMISNFLVKYTPPPSTTPMVLWDYTWQTTIPNLTAYVSAEVLGIVFSWHTQGVDATIHATTLQAALTAEFPIPPPSLSVTADIPYALYDVITVTNPPVLFAADTVNGQIVSYLTPSSGLPVADNSFAGLGLTGFTPVYGNAPLGDRLARLNGTLFVVGNFTQAASAIGVLALTSQTTQDSLAVIVSPLGTPGYQIVLIHQGTTTTLSAPVSGSLMCFTLVYTPTYLTLSYVDSNGNEGTQTGSVVNLALDLDSIQLGVALAPLNTVSSGVQILRAYPSVLSSATSLLLLTTLPT